MKLNTQRGLIDVGALLLILLGFIVLGGGTYYLIQDSSSSILQDNSTSTLPISNTASQNESIEVAANTTTQSTTQSATSAVLVQGHNMRQASVFLLDSHIDTGRKVLELPNLEYPYVPKVVTDKGVMYYRSAKNSISRLDIKTGEISAILIKDLSDSQRIRDFSVKGSLLAYLVVAPANNETLTPHAQSCELRVLDMVREFDAKILDITLCSLSHGPNYRIENISSDGAIISLLASYSEAGYASIERYEVHLASKTGTLIETVSFSPVCGQGTFSNASECTQEVQSKNTQYDVFIKQHERRLGWTDQCGNISIKGDEKEYHTVHVSAVGKTEVFKYSEFAGCLNQLPVEETAPSAASAEKTCSLTTNDSTVTPGEEYVLTWTTNNIANPMLSEGLRAGGMFPVAERGSRSWTAEPYSSSSTQEEVFQIGVMEIGSPLFKPICSVTVYNTPNDTNVNEAPTDKSNWKTTTIEQLGIGFKHPADASISSVKQRLAGEGTTITEVIVTPSGMDPTQVHFFTTTASLDTAKYIQIYGLDQLKSSNFREATIDGLPATRKIDRYHYNECTYELTITGKNGVVYGYHMVQCPTHPPGYDQLRKEIVQSLKLM